MTRGQKICLICGLHGHTSSACASPAAKYARTKHKQPPRKPPPPPTKPDDEDEDWYDYLLLMCLRQVAGWVRGEAVLDAGFAGMRRLLEEHRPVEYWAYFHNALKSHGCLFPGCPSPRKAYGFCPTHVGQLQRRGLL